MKQFVFLFLLISMNCWAGPEEKIKGANDWKMLYGQDAFDTSYEIWRAIEASYFPDCEIDVTRDGSTIKVLVVKKITKSSLGDSLNFSFSPKDFPFNERYFLKGQYKITVSNDIKDLRVFKNEIKEVPEPQLKDGAAKLVVTYTTDSTYKKVLQISFILTAHYLSNVGSIRERVYETRQEVLRSFSCQIRQ